MKDKVVVGIIVLLVIPIGLLFFIGDPHGPPYALMGYMIGLLVAEVAYAALDRGR